MEIAEHLGISQPAVSQQMAPIGIDWQKATMDEIRLAYLTHLRGVAAGHRSVDGMDLARERALTEQVDRELKHLTLAERKGQLVNVAQLEPELQRQYVAFKAELEARDDKLKEELDLLYGIDIDLELISSHTRNALSHLSRHDPSGGRSGGKTTPVRGPISADDHDGVGDGAAHAEPEGDGEAWPLQP
jgi:hypothetical protein